MDINQRKIANIHDFTFDFNTMSERLRALKPKFPSGLIIPIFGDDIKSPGLTKMVEEINKCDYLRKVFIALSTKEADNYEDALRLCRGFKVPCEVIWCNKPAVLNVLEELKRSGLDVTQLSGKGKDVWLAMGIASLELRAFAVHDADIVSYDKMLPTKLLYPVIEPKLDFFFSKGYYARINFEKRRFYGRIHRLFISPLLEILQEKLRYSRFLTYLQSFSYPLAGEIALYSDLSLHLRVASDWGLELGLLAELYRNAAYRRICEVDLGFYEHRHKPIGPDGLLKTAEDSFVTLLRTLTEMENMEVSQPFLISLQVAYRRAAQDKIRQYHADATCNNLSFDRHEEEANVDLLSSVILSGGQKYLENPVRAQLPDWLRAIAAMPNIREKLRENAIET
ncbi:MAG: glucosyl-3-phosphoglycerate synthase [Candidatus Bathyarchaeota archaeon]|nr:glucosyl-3-phosphoglycerate synthase [Candidatus Bathyarchaeota archaeon]